MARTMVMEDLLDAPFAASGTPGMLAFKLNP
jgi:hypothetical protein